MRGRKRHTTSRGLHRGFVRPGPVAVKRSNPERNEQKSEIGPGLKSDRKEKKKKAQTSVEKIISSRRHKTIRNRLNRLAGKTGCGERRCFLKKTQDQGRTEEPPAPVS